MAFWAPLLTAVVAGMPVAFELDFRALPVANTVPGYKFTITITLDGKPAVPLNFTVGTTASPSDVAKMLVTSLKNSPWELKRDGDRVAVYSYDKARVTKITVTGDGPKPLVLRVPAPPPPKK